VDGSNKVALYLIDEDYLVVENFNDEPIDASIALPSPVRALKVLVVPSDGELDILEKRGELSLSQITPGTLVVIEH
jgi:hypothetical protein